MFKTSGTSFLTEVMKNLQHDEALESIIKSCQKVNNDKASSSDSKIKPLLIKIAPDLSDEQLVAVVNTARSAGCDGIIATNTTVERPKTFSKSEGKIFAETGGLSGAPLAKRSTDMIHQIYSMTNGEWPIVGVGGIQSADDAWDKIGAGATLLQAYSGFVFEGAALTRSIIHGLDKKLKENGYSSLQEAVGFAHRSKNE